MNTLGTRAALAAAGLTMLGVQRADASWLTRLLRAGESNEPRHEAHREQHDRDGKRDERPAVIVKVEPRRDAPAKNDRADESRRDVDDRRRNEQKREREDHRRPEPLVKNDRREARPVYWPTPTPREDRGARDTRENHGTRGEVVIVLPDITSPRDERRRDDDRRREPAWETLDAGFLTSVVCLSGQRLDVRAEFTRDACGKVNALVRVDAIGTGCAPEIRKAVLIVEGDGNCWKRVLCEPTKDRRGVLTYTTREVPEMEACERYSVKLVLEAGDDEDRDSTAKLSWDHVQLAAR